MGLLQQKLLKLKYSKWKTAIDIIQIKSNEKINDNTNVIVNVLLSRSRMLFNVPEKGKIEIL